ncbi:MAG: twin-arginine translocation signal domain-containing protein [Hyphomicrobiaceae bacterium]
MADKTTKGLTGSGHVTDGVGTAGTPSTAAKPPRKSALNRRDYLKSAAVVAGAGAASIGMPSIAKAQNKTYKLKLQSNWTGIGIESQDRAAKLFVDRINKMSGGRIEVTNFNAEVLLGIGETFRGVGSGVADLAVTSSIYHRGIVPVGEYLWAVPFFPVTTLEFYEQIYHFMGIKELWQEAYKPHNVAHLTYMISDEWGAMVSTRQVEKFADFKGMKVRAFGIWADWLVHNAPRSSPSQAARCTRPSRPSSSTLRLSDHRMPGRA